MHTLCNWDSSHIVCPALNSSLRIWQDSQQLRVCLRTRLWRFFSMCSSLYLTFFPNSLFRRYRVKGDLGAHTTTSLTIAHAITHGGLDPQDLPMWRTIFQRTFHKSIAVQLGDERENIWFVDARRD